MSEQQHDDHKQLLGGNKAANMIEFRFLIDNSSVGGIIGKGGANVKKVREESGAYVSILKIEQHNVADRIMTIKGSQQGVIKAASLLCDLLADAANKDHAADATVELKMLVHQVSVGAIIGKAGAVIKETQSESGARVQIAAEPLPGSTEKAVTISGTTAAVEAALSRIIQQLLDNPLKAGTRSTDYVPGALPQYPIGYPANHAPYPPRSRHNGSSMMIGTPQDDQPSTQKIAIPTICAGCIIGKGGSVIRDLRNRSGTNISVNDPDPANPNERVVTLSGTRQGIDAAVLMIRTLVESYQPQPQSGHY